MALAADAILNTSDMNQNVLTATQSLLVCWSKENCRVVAVILEKKVAMVAIFEYLSLR